MKKFIFIFGILITVGLCNTSSAQNVNVNININSQPAWGPVGYDYAAFYYFPDLNIYFDVNNALFYYTHRGSWVSNRYLPNKYHKYDLYVLYKVVLNDSRPWAHNRVHKRHYAVYKNNRAQTPIRHSNDSRYFASRRNSHVWANPNRIENNNRRRNDNAHQPDNSYKGGNRNNNKNNATVHVASNRRQSDNKQQINNSNNRGNNKNNSRNHQAANNRRR